MPENVVYIPSDHWNAPPTKENKMEKKPRRWPAVVASAVLALGLGAGVVVLKDKDTLELTLPIYTDNIWEKFSDGYTSEDYDAMAEFDMLIFGHEVYVHDRHNGLVDSVRTRNPDFIPLFYAFIYGCRSGWGESGGFYAEIYNMVDRNDYWIRDYHGDIVIGPATNDPTIPVQFFNCGAPGLADSLAAIHAKWMYARGHVQHHTGMFLDWITTPYPQWPTPVDRDDYDFNRNGIPYRDDPKDEAMNSQYPEQIAKAFRKAFSTEPTFLLMLNGNAHYAKDNEYTHLFDGGMYELHNLYYPRSQDHREKAMSHIEFFDNSRVNPPLLMFQGGEEDSVGYTTEALASIAGAACNFQFRHLPRRIELGKRVMDPVWSGDTVTTIFSRQDGAQFTSRVVYDNFIWPYLITSFDGADTLSRGGGWPAAVPPTALYLVLDDFNNYLTFHMGEPISLSTISYWAGTTVDIIAACEKEN
jgi:hypothetical protein